MLGQEGLEGQGEPEEQEGLEKGRQNEGIWCPSWAEGIQRREVRIRLATFGHGVRIVSLYRFDKYRRLRIEMRRQSV